MARHRFVSVSFVVTVFLVGYLPRAQAQMAAVTNSTSTPIPGAGHDYIKMLSETVDPANGSLSVRVQVPVPPARGLTIPFSFAYDSNGVHFMANGITPGTAGWDTVRNTDPSGANVALGGWSYTVPMLSYQNLAATTGAGGPDPCSYSGTGGFVFTDATGGRHSLNLGHASQPQPLTCPPHYSEIDSASDPYYQAKLVGGTVPVIVGPDGTVYKFGSAAPSGGESTSVQLPTSIEDRNGNIATVNRDTLGRTSVSWSGFGSTGNTVTVSGLTNSYTLTWGTASFNFTPGTNEVVGSYPSGVCAGPVNGSGTQPVVTTITLPNSQKYTFSYDSTFGHVNKITYPSGGYVSYTWNYNSLSALGSFWANATGGAPCLWIYSKPAITDRYVSFDGSAIALHQHFAYSTNWTPNAGTWTTKTTKSRQPTRFASPT